MSHEPPVVTRSMQRRVAFTSTLGTTIEWYDYFIYAAAAALVFAPQFFPSEDPVTGLLASFATFAVGFIARPIGGLVMGHFGDRVGRKSMLVLSVLLMGVGTVGIGLLPNYEAIGVLAPILLVFLRLVQGFGVGGEWGGAVLMTVEHAPRAKRTFYGSLVQMGVPLGIILSNLAFILVLNVIEPDAFAAWGWRLPFLVSALLVVVGLVIRLRVTESPTFAKLRDTQAVKRFPLLEMLARHWKPLILASFASIAAPALGYLVLVYMITYGTTQLELPQLTMLWLVVGGAAWWTIVIGLSAQLADKIGRKPVFAGGALLVIVTAFPFFWLVDTGSPGLILVAFLLATTAVGGMAGPQAALVASLFPSSVRYSGASTAYQVGSILGGAIAPLVATALLEWSGTSMSIATYMAVIGLVSFVAILFVRNGAMRSFDDDEVAVPAMTDARA
ncbi:MFS transporter [Pseudoclavibacter endophyticus]|nr:MFS transporter [Pseudoclavibacter endophyticus]